MPHVAQKDEDEPARKPKFRLTDMHTQEVGIVDLAANLMHFLTVKRSQMGKQADTTTNPTTKVAMPAAAKEALSKGIENVLTALNDAIALVADATVDEKAAVPEDVVTSLAKASIELTGLSEQYKASTDEKPASAAKPPEAPSADEADTEKAGRKISAARMKQIRAAHTALGQILSDVEPDEDKKGKTKKDGDEPDLAAELGKMTKVLEGLPTAVVDGVKEAVKPAVEKAAEADKAVAGLKEQQAKLSKALKGGGESALESGEETPQPTRKGWGTDMSEVYRKRQQERQQT